MYGSVPRSCSVRSATRKSVDHLTSLLTDENVAVRREAFEALEMIKKRTPH